MGARPALANGVLYVSDTRNDAIEMFAYLSHKWTRLGALGGGVNLGGSWVDRSGNLYQSIYGNGDVAEWASGNQIFTYSAGLEVPEAVTTDRYGVVYVADETGSVTEYPQGSNSPAISCQAGSHDQATGVALDRHGDVFVNIFDSANIYNYIVEYPHGLIASNCHGTKLPPILQQAFYGGLAVDPQGNLLVCNGFEVAIMAPPYTSITGALGTGWNDATSVTINRAGTQAYVTDGGAATVSVVSYPSGSILATLGSANGLTLPISAVDTNNYVP